MLGTIGRFVLLVLVAEVAAAIAIKLAGGQPFASMSGWEGLLALIGMILVVVIVYGGLVAYGRYQLDLNVALIAAGVALAILVALMLAPTPGWLSAPVDNLQDGGGLWWPVVVLGGCVITWLGRLSRR